MTQGYKITVIGQSWHGSNCTGLARGFRELGHVVELIGSDQFFPKTDQTVSSKIIRRLLASRCSRQFNEYIKAQIRLHKPDVVVVFKGSFVDKSTLCAIGDSGAWLVNFYPDISFMNHRGLDPGTFPLYDHIFTTKSFGIRDFAEKLGVENATFLPHGFDPSVHHPAGVDQSQAWLSDVSFIGTWSAHKQHLLESLVSNGGNRSVCIHGAQWEQARNSPLNSSIAGFALLGDHYASTISASKINLGLLSERTKGASSGDQITSRTFHIPACGGFMLHERTQEVLQYYEEGREIACFESPEELAAKVEYYLNHEDERAAIAKAGYRRCITENSLANRAQVILDKYEALQCLN